jgi:hypothetical protein
MWSFRVALFLRASGSMWVFDFWVQLAFFGVALVLVFFWRSRRSRLFGGLCVYRVGWLGEEKGLVGRAGLWGIARFGDASDPRDIDL